MTSDKFRLPDQTELRNLAAALDLALSPDEVQAMLGHMAPFAAGYGWLDDAEDALPPAAAPRRWWRPEENPFGGWEVQCEIRGNPSGPLAGRSVAIKDNIFVAGVPLSNGAAWMDGFVPEFDASVVTRLLDAGATIAGKARCEYLCVSGGSATASGGMVENPNRPGYSAGGSSSGSAALVAGGIVDFALGCDQGGSIRIPSSWCGVYGMKPSHGLLPYSGIIGMEASLDHVGPITRNVADNALLLSLLAGPDGMDGRQRGEMPGGYQAALGQSLKGLRIGVLREGFDHPLCEADVAAAVYDAARRFETLGAEVSEVSIPLHQPGVGIWGAVVSEGLWRALNQGGYGGNGFEPQSPGLIGRLAKFGKHFKELPLHIQTLLLLASHLERYRGRYYGKAKNWVVRLRAAYDQALADVDLLLLPTTLTKARSNPESQDRITPAQLLGFAFDPVLNCGQFDISGHPAMSLPCALRDGLPIGMMLVGRHGGEATIYRAASGFEQAVDWKTR